MVKIGMIVGDRYEILERIGTGGMSDVYKAKDHKLNRMVAVKVLKQEFSENANFVSKFRVEAQAAAGLAHPNIVNVYDVGEENGVYYIVMELVEGITLKKYIEKKARLSVKEAVSIAIQVSMGIEAAHNNHIIHRDIKPQNIIISKEGKVKVTDFGIAKAATSNTITSNVMGSVHYTSPEQARGGYSDEKSDVYSLGITMFEMLTGRVPFNGETTVAIAIKHIQEEMPSPRDYVSEIPVSVEQIVFKCCQKSPDRRYQSMGELITDLKRSLMTPDEDFVKMVDPDEDGSTKMISSGERQKIKKQSVNRDGMEEAMHLRREADVKKSVKKKRYVPEYEEEEEEELDEIEYEYEEEEDEEEEDYDPKMERITTILAVVAAVLIGCIVLFLVGRAFGIFDTGLFGQKEEETQEEEEPKEKVQMIEVVGKGEDEVKVDLLKLGLTPEIEYKESAEYEQGIVMDCSVGAGEMIEEGSNVVLTVSAGSEGVEVPDVVGISEAEAVATLGKGGFPVNKTEGHDAYIKEGNVITQSPEAGSKVPAGTAVTIRISQGPEVSKVQVPDTIGRDESEGMAILVEAGLQMGKVTEVHHSDPAMAGLICYQSYSVGDYVEAGTVVDVSISIGPEEAVYQFIESIAAPTAQEDPNYRSGTMVTVTLMADDGTQLYSTQTSSFPIDNPGISGIKSSTGYILFQYVNATEASSITHEDGSVTTTEASSETKEFKRTVQFMEG
ncbi:Stk1 family PASTA domain-containing Ser/Thr kinase [bacterium 1xD8-48]|nr:Stk1 family PASTA domain-containing Ser/Thr kinase [Lachnospiraceae bacterium]NBJ97148.1 Stk1 family PASTA domain-containing Ser/Thr kinase [bacterium 1xD8-48]